jgi:hypothetical protein
MKDDLQQLYGDVLDVWRPWSSALRGRGISGAQHMAENRPAYVAFPSGLGARGVHGTASPSKARAPVFASLISNGQIPSLSPLGFASDVNERARRYLRVRIC